jgi:hypothetical protein
LPGRSTRGGKARARARVDEGKAEARRERGEARGVGRKEGEGRKPAVGVNKGERDERGQ